MQHVHTAIAHLALAIFVALGVSALDRCASARSGVAGPPAAPHAGAIAPISLLDNRPVPPPPRLPLFGGLSWLHLRVPGPTGAPVWGASLSLPFALHKPLPQTGVRLPVLRPTPEIEIGFRSIGKATGGVIEYVTPGGMRIGGGIYLNNIAVGAPAARQAMISFKIPLP
jgi:hypothetical protein